MATTYTLIDKTTLTGTQTSITFTGLGAYSSNYTDLLLKVSARDNNSASANGSYYSIGFNGSTSNLSATFLRNTAGSVGSGTFAGYGGTSTTTAQTADTFNNDEIYIPNFSSSNYKSYSTDNVVENNGTAVFTTLIAGLWSDTSAITSITLSAGGGSFSFVSGSSFYLYGIKKN